MDTIFALASARGKAGVAVIRLSGPASWIAVQDMASSLPEPRVGAVRSLRNEKGEVLDEALVLCFSPGASFTGEESAELHLHGSIATVSAVFDVLSRKSGLRLAEAGEFTRRALENGRMDLAQVEGLGDLIEAETEAQRKQALRILEGALGKKADTWRKNLIAAVSLLEATIDFSDEDVPVDVYPEVRSKIGSTITSLQEESDGSRISERIRDGFEVAIVGPPNVGKSTLLNRLAGREAAITSEIAGTTRDVIEVRVDLEGLAVTILDTAGLRPTKDEVEGLGIERAVQRAKAADLRVFLVGGSQVSDFRIQPKPNDIVVRGKADKYNYNKELTVSGLTGFGVEELVKVIGDKLQKLAAGAATATRLRHRLAIDKAISTLKTVQSMIDGEIENTELTAEELRHAIQALDSLIGKVDVESVLDEIFANFCIGK